MQSKRHATCNHCGKLKRRTPSRVTPSGLRVFTLGRGGRAWSGFTCPDCRYATKNTNDEGEDLDLNPMTHRKCRSCGAKLRVSHYFKCASCYSILTHLEGQYSAEDYGYGYYGRKTGTGSQFSHLQFTPTGGKLG